MHKTHSEYQTEIFATVIFAKYVHGIKLNEKHFETNTRHNIPWGKRQCGRYAELSFYADLTQFTLTSYSFWLAQYMNFSR